MQKPRAEFFAVAEIIPPRTPARLVGRQPGRYIYIYIYSHLCSSALFSLQSPVVAGRSVHLEASTIVYSSSTEHHSARLLGATTDSNPAWHRRADNLRQSDRRTLRIHKGKPIREHTLPPPTPVSPEGAQITPEGPGSDATINKKNIILLPTVSRRKR